MHPYNSFVILAILSLLSLGLLGQSQLTLHTLSLDQNNSPAKAVITDLEWLAGRWTGDGFGGQVEEIWSPAAGGAMLATFRLLQDDKPSFYELCLLVEENNSVSYKVKHFNPDFTGWEEQDKYVTFPLVKIEGNSFYFQGLTYERVGDTCHIYLAMKQKDGSYQEANLIYYRQRD